MSDAKVIKDRIKSLKRIPAKDLIVNKKNWRKHPEEQQAAIRTVLSEIGFASTCLVREMKNGKFALIDGHLRAEVASEEKIPCLVLDVTAKEADRLLATFDPITNMADADDELLAALIRSLDNESQEMDELLESIADENGIDLTEQIEDGLTEDDAVPDTPKKAFSKPGDIWILGSHRVMCGDSTDEASVALLMNGDECDYGFTSPPYNAGDNHLGGNSNKVDSKYEDGGDDRTGDEFMDLLSGFTDAWLQFCKCFTINIQQLAGNKIVVLEYLYKYRHHFIDMAIWNKGHAAPAMPRNVMNSCFEYMIFLSPEEMPKRTIPCSDFRGTQRNIYDGGGNSSNEFSAVHAATFPIDLPLWAIESFTTKGAIVADSFGGTGTTLIACQKTGRSCRMMELSEYYTDVIVQRWQDYTGEKAIRDSDGVEFKMVTEKN